MWRNVVVIVAEESIRGDIKAASAENGSIFHGTVLKIASRLNSNGVIRREDSKWKGDV